MTIDDAPRCAMCGDPLVDGEYTSVGDMLGEVCDGCIAYAFDSVGYVKDILPYRTAGITDEASGNTEEP